jgi:hypothetical protein
VAVLARARPLSLSLSTRWDQPVAASFLRPFTLSLSRGPRSPAAEPLPRASLFLSLRRGPAVSVSPSPRSPWTGACTLTHVAGFLDHDARPRAPTPFLEPRQCPALVRRLISHTLALSRALPLPPDAAGDPCPFSRPSSSPKTAPSLPELRPEVRHPSRAQFPLLRPMFVLFRLRRCSATAVHRARTVAGRLSPV